MGFQDFVSETEASSFTGVSPVTLKRFADAGYLRVEVESDGLRMFSRSELETVFGLAPVIPSVRQTTAEGTPVEPEGVEILKEIYLSSQKPAVEEVETSAHPQKVETFAPAEAAETVAVSSESQTTQAPQPSQALIALEREVTRLKSIVELQEKYIDLKEQEVKSTREDRDWLRERIEKLEEKNDRDQLILVSVSETNRGLITMLEHKKSPIRSALEWVGLLPSPPPPTPTRTNQNS